MIDTKYIDQHPELASLLSELHIEILDKKPDDILKYLKEEVFSEKNLPNLYQKYNVKDDGK